jgi:hypothetical protein
MGLNEEDQTMIRDMIFNASRSNRPLTLRGLEPTPFTGSAKDDANVWLAQVEGYFDLSGTSDLERVTAMKLLMKGVPRIWWDSLESSQPTDTGTNMPKALTMQIVKEKFIARFSLDSNKWQLREVLDNVTLASNGDVDHYLDEILTLTHKLEMAEGEIKTTLIRNLYGELRAFVISASPKSLEDVVEKIRLGSTTIAMSRKIRSTGEARIVQSGKDQVHHAVEAQVQQITEAAQDAVRAIASQANSMTANKSYTTRGAFATDASPCAPSDYRNQGQDRKPIQDSECYFCHKRGHYARDCRQKQYWQNKRPSGRNDRQDRPTERSSERYQGNSGYRESSQRRNDNSYSKRNTNQGYRSTDRDARPDNNNRNRLN